MTLSTKFRIRNGEFVASGEFEIPDGKTAALIGPNGAGKSTVIAALAGLLPLEEGFIRIGGRILDKLPPQARRVGLVPQGGLLFRHMTIFENVAFPMRARGRPVSAAAEWLERFGIAHLAETRADRVSGGEAQRAAVARALAAEPEMLLLDEPLAAVDIESRRELGEIIRLTIREFGGVRLLVTHDPAEALDFADHLIVMDRGAVVQSGSADEIRRRPGSPFVASFLGIK